MERAIAKFSPNGKALKEIYKFSADFYGDKGGKGNITIPFHNYLYWTIYNDYIVARESWADFISIFDLQGNLTKKIPLPFKKEKVTKEDLDNWEARLKSIRWVRNGIAEGWFDLKYWRKSLPFPAYKPVSGYPLFIDSHGFLYSMKSTGYNAVRAICAKIDVSTGNVKIVNFRPGEWLLSTWKNYFFIHKLNDENNYVVVKIKEKEFFRNI